MPDLPPVVPPYQAILTGVTRRCVAEIGVDGATIAIATGPTSWMPGPASDATMDQLEQDAYIVGEGPSFDALRDHVPVLAPDLDLPVFAEKWPAWVDAARRREIRSAAAFPIQAGAISAGVLNLYSYDSGDLDDERFGTALRLADTAFLGLLDLMAGLSRSDAATPDPALVRHADVHRAAGMVMVQAGLPIDLALARLRAYAFGSGRTLTDVAADVVTRRLRFPPDDPLAH